MFAVILVDEYNGNEFIRSAHKSEFDCEVEVDHRKYNTPSGCHYEVREVSEAVLRQNGFRI